MTTTISTVVLVDLLGIGKLPKAFALFNLIATIGSMLAAPVAGWLTLLHFYDTIFILNIYLILV